MTNNSENRLLKNIYDNQNVMEQFRVKVADQDGNRHFFNIEVLGEDRYSIYNIENQRLGSIEIDKEDHEQCRQTLDCQIRLPLLNAIRDGILEHQFVLH